MTFKFSNAGRCKACVAREVALRGASFYGMSNGHGAKDVLRGHCVQHHEKRTMHIAAAVAVQKAAGSRCCWCTVTLMLLLLRGPSWWQSHSTDLRTPLRAKRAASETCFWQPLYRPSVRVSLSLRRLTLLPLGYSDLSALSFSRILLFMNTHVVRCLLRGHVAQHRCCGPSHIGGR